MTTTLTKPPADAVPEPPRRLRRSKSARAGGQMHAGPLAYVILALFTIGSLGPLVWTAIAASRDTNRLAQTPPPFWFGSNLFHNLDVAWTEANLGEAFVNTTFVAGVSAVTVVFLSTLAGFAFAKLRFKGRGALMLIVVGTMMVPPQLSVIPLYMMVAKLDWTDQLQAVIFPSLVSAFGVFFMRQYLIQALPDELIEAARVDGASSWRVTGTWCSRPPGPPWRCSACWCSCRRGTTSCGRSWYSPRPATRPCRSRSRASAAVHSRPVPDHGGRVARHAAAAVRLRPVRQADRRRHHAGRRQGLTSFVGGRGEPGHCRPGPSSPSSLPSPLPLFFLLSVSTTSYGSASMPESASPVTFPAFLWGAATCTYRSRVRYGRAGRTPSIWDTFSHTPARQDGRW